MLDNKQLSSGVYRMKHDSMTRIYTDTYKDDKVRILEEESTLVDEVLGLDIYSAMHCCQSKNVCDYRRYCEVRFDTYVKTQELTEGTFLFEQQVHRELQECTYEDWCVLLEDEKRLRCKTKVKSFNKIILKELHNLILQKQSVFLSTKDTFY